MPSIFCFVDLVMMMMDVAGRRQLIRCLSSPDVPLCVIKTRRLLALIACTSDHRSCGFSSMACPVSLIVRTEPLRR